MCDGGGGGAVETEETDLRPAQPTSLSPACEPGPTLI